MKNDTGAVLRDRGIEKAICNADAFRIGWRDVALTFCKWYALTHDVFSGEQVRVASRGEVPVPPHLRAWGAIMVSAAKQGIIEKIGYTQVENPKAHMANAALWQSKIYSKGML